MVTDWGVHVFFERSLTWLAAGDVAVQFYGPALYVKRDLDIESVQLYVPVGSEPTGCSLIVDIEDDGASIFSTTPEIDAGQHLKDGNEVFSATTIAAGSWMRMRVLQKGSTLPGTDLTVMLNCMKILVWVP
ncbi:hypothetical protein KKE60_04285 [Patescibacteria group bacterium]|nr:hypothetical protein [Patescibacteria group bacterium]